MSTEIVNNGNNKFDSIAFNKAFNEFITNELKVDIKSYVLGQIKYQSLEDFLGAKKQLLVDFLKTDTGKVYANEKDIENKAKISTDSLIRILLCTQKEIINNFGEFKEMLKATKKWRGKKFKASNLIAGHMLHCMKNSPDDENLSFFLKMYRNRTMSLRATLNLLPDALDDIKYEIDSKTTTQDKQNAFFEGIKDLFLWNRQFTANGKGKSHELKAKNQFFKIVEQVFERANQYGILDDGFANKMLKWIYENLRCFYPKSLITGTNENEINPHPRGKIKSVNQLLCILKLKDLNSYLEFLESRLTPLKQENSKIEKLESEIDSLKNKLDKYIEEPNTVNKITGSDIQNLNLETQKLGDEVEYLSFKSEVKLLINNINTLKQSSEVLEETEQLRNDVEQLSNQIEKPNQHSYEQIKNLEVTFKQLHDKYTQLDVKNRIQQLEDKVKKLDLSQTTNDNMEQLQKEFKVLDDKAQKLLPNKTDSELIKSLKTKVEEMGDKINELDVKNRIKQLDDKLGQPDLSQISDNSVKQLQKEYNVLLDKAKKLVPNKNNEKQIEPLKTKVEEMGDKINELDVKNRIKQLEDKLKLKQPGLNKITDGQIEQLQKEFKELDDKAQKLLPNKTDSELIKSLKTKVEEMGDKINELDFKNKNKQVEQLEDKVDQLLNGNDNFSEGDVKQLKKEFDVLGRKVKELVSNKNGSNAEQIDPLKTKLKGVGDKINELDFKNKNKQVEQLEDKVGQLLNGNDNFTEDDVKRLQNDVKVLVSKINKLNKNNNNEGQIKSLQTKLKETRDRIKKFKDQADSKIKSHENNSKNPISVNEKIINKSDISTNMKNGNTIDNINDNNLTMKHPLSNKNFEEKKVDIENEKNNKEQINTVVNLPIRSQKELINDLKALNGNDEQQRNDVMTKWRAIENGKYMRWDSLDVVSLLKDGMIADNVISDVSEIYFNLDSSQKTFFAQILKEQWLFRYQPPGNNSEITDEEKKKQTEIKCVSKAFAENALDKTKLIFDFELQKEKLDANKYSDINEFLKYFIIDLNNLQTVKWLVEWTKKNFKNQCIPWSEFGKEKFMHSYPNIDVLYTLQSIVKFDNEQQKHNYKAVQSIWTKQPISSQDIPTLTTWLRENFNGVKIKWSDLKKKLDISMFSIANLSNCLDIVIDFNPDNANIGTDPVVENCVNKFLLSIKQGINNQDDLINLLRLCDCHLIVIVEAFFNFNFRITDLFNKGIIKCNISNIDGIYKYCTNTFALRDIGIDSFDRYMNVIYEFKHNRLNFDYNKDKVWSDFINWLIKKDGIRFSNSENDKDKYTKEMNNFLLQARDKIVKMAQLFSNEAFTNMKSIFNFGLQKNELELNMSKYGNIHDFFDHWYEKPIKSRDIKAIVELLNKHFPNQKISWQDIKTKFAKPPTLSTCDVLTLDSLEELQKIVDFGSKNDKIPFEEVSLYMTENCMNSLELLQKAHAMFDFGETTGNNGKMDIYSIGYFLEKGVYPNKFITSTDMFGKMCDIIDFSNYNGYTDWWLIGDNLLTPALKNIESLSEMISKVNEREKNNQKLKTTKLRGSDLRFCLDKGTIASMEQFRKMLEITEPEDGKIFFDEDHRKLLGKSFIGTMSDLRFVLNNIRFYLSKDRPQKCTPEQICPCLSKDFINNNNIESLKAIVDFGQKEEIRWDLIGACLHSDLLKDVDSLKQIRDKIDPDKNKIPWYMVAPCLSKDFINNNNIEALQEIIDFGRKEEIRWDLIGAHLHPDLLKDVDSLKQIRDRIDPEQTKISWNMIANSLPREFITNDNIETLKEIVDFGQKEKIRWDLIGAHLHPDLRKDVESLKQVRDKIDPEQNKIPWNMITPYLPRNFVTNTNGLRYMKKVIDFSSDNAKTLEMKNVCLLYNKGYFKRFTQLDAYLLFHFPDIRNNMEWSDIEYLLARNSIAKFDTLKNMVKTKNFISQVKDFSIFEPGAFQDYDTNDKTDCKKLGLEYKSTGLYVFFALIGLPLLFIPTIICGIKAYRAHCFNCKIDNIKTAIIENQQKFKKQQQAQQANNKANNAKENQKEDQIENTVAKVKPIKPVNYVNKENINPNIQTVTSNSKANLADKKIISIKGPVPKQEVITTKTEEKNKNQNADDIKTDQYPK